MSEPNPFTGLIDTETVQTPTPSTPTISTIPTMDNDDKPITASNTTHAPQINPLDKKINALIEHVFAMTVTRQPLPPRQRPLVYMEEIAPLCPQPILGIAVLDQALFERLLLNNPADYLLPSDVPADQTRAVVVEKRVISYLHGAYVRNARRRADAATAADTCVTDACGRIDELIVRNASTAVKQPDLYEGQQYGLQLLEILQDTDMDAEWTGRFLSALVRDVLNDADAHETQNLRKVFASVFMEMRRVARTASLGTLDGWLLPALHLFAADKTNVELAMLLVDGNRPTASAVSSMGAVVAPNVALVPNGASYADTLFGDLLRLSILPKQQNGRAEYFQVRMQIIRIQTIGTNN